jgi:alpha-N-acetylglucosamine transferase
MWCVQHSTLFNVVRFSFRTRLLHFVAPVNRIQPVAVTANPNAGFQSRLVFVYTKLLIFNMVEYDRVVFLDSDTLVRHYVNNYRAINCCFAASKH